MNLIESFMHAVFTLPIGFPKLTKSYSHLSNILLTIGIAEVKAVCNGSS